MTAVAYAHPTISRFAIADGMLHIGGLPVGLDPVGLDPVGLDPVGLDPVGLLAERAGATPFFAYERTGLGHPTPTALLV